MYGIVKIVQYRTPLANEKATDAIFELKKYMRNIDAVSIAIFTKYTLRNLKQKNYMLLNPTTNPFYRFRNFYKLFQNLPKFLYCSFHKN